MAQTATTHAAGDQGPPGPGQSGKTVNTGSALAGCLAGQVVRPGGRSPRVRTHRGATHRSCRIRGLPPPRRDPPGRAELPRPLAIDPGSGVSADQDRSRGHEHAGVGQQAHPMDARPTTSTTCPGRSTRTGHGEQLGPWSGQTASRLPNRAVPTWTMSTDLGHGLGVVDHGGPSRGATVGHGYCREAWTRLVPLQQGGDGAGLTEHVAVGPDRDLPRWIRSGGSPSVGDGLGQRSPGCVRATVDVDHHPVGSYHGGNRGGSVQHQVGPVGEQGLILPAGRLALAGVHDEQGSPGARIAVSSFRARGNAPPPRPRRPLSRTMERMASRWLQGSSGPRRRS